MAEGCSVSLVGHPSAHERGPTPFERPFLASELAAMLLDRVPSIAAPTISFAFEVRPLLVFSYELEASVMERLGRLGASIELRINDSDEPFDAYESRCELEVWTDARDPMDVTTRLGVTPTTLLRAGDPIAPGDSRRAKRGRWELQVEGHPGNINDLVRDLLPEGRLAEAAWDDVRRDHEARLRIVWMVSALAGCVTLDADVVARVAALRVPLACYHYNEGA